MDPAEYANLERVEQNHWYYAGKRVLVRWWLERLAIIAGKRPRLLDCGAGTGRFAAEMTDACEVWALDDHEESLELLRKRLSPARVLKLDGPRLPADDASFEIVTALDVLEHIPDDVSAVKEIRRVLAPGGVFLATVPASMALWSDWDESLHHQRRYSRKSLVAVFPSEEWEIVHVNYTNVLVFPLVWAIRKARRLTGRKGGRSEDAIPAKPINAILKWLFVATGKCRLPFPFGVSLLLFVRKRTQDHSPQMPETLRKS